MDYGDKLPPMPVVHFCAAAPVHNLAAVDTFHHISPKHLPRHVNEFATRHNLREHDTEVMMGETVSRMVGKRLMYRELIAD